MDPASAAVAFVGFTASLTTLVGLAVDSLKTLHRLHEKIKDGPEGILRLQRDFRHLQALLFEIQGQQREISQSSGLTTTSELWSGSGKQMQQDMEIFRTFLSDLDRRTDRTSISSKNLRLRIRLFFEEDRITELQRRLSTHIQFLHIVESLMSLYVSPYSFYRCIQPNHRSVQRKAQRSFKQDYEAC